MVGRKKDIYRRNGAALLDCRQLFQGTNFADVAQESARLTRGIASAIKAS